MGTDKGKIIKLNIKTGQPEGMPINVNPDDKPVTSIHRFKGLSDQNVFLTVADGKELYVYAEARNDCTLVDFGADNDSEQYKNLDICDIYVSDNAKFYVIGVPEKKAFGIFSFNRNNFISAPVRWIQSVSNYFLIKLIIYV